MCSAHSWKRLCKQYVIITLIAFSSLTTIIVVAVAVGSGGGGVRSFGAKNLYRYLRIAHAHDLV